MGIDTAMRAKTILVCAALLGSLTAGAAVAQPAAPPLPATSVPPTPVAATPAQAPIAAATSATQKAAEQRIQALRTGLGITPEQTPLWDAFAQAMRDNAASTDQLFQRRATTVATMTAVDNMRSYAEIARDYANNTERLSTAFDSLYASLSDPQKQAADTLFRQQAAASAQPHK
jgi:periplasmic protein CpxP/Spy